MKAWARCLAGVALAAVTLAPLHARNCVKGKRCGNTCIASHLTCRVGGSAPGGAATYVVPAPVVVKPSAALPTAPIPVVAIPTFNERQFCRVAAARVQEDGDWVERCVDRELAAKQELRRLSPAVFSGRVAPCAAGVSVGQQGSYQALLACALRD